ncbi:MAG: hypothetical protein ACPG4F_07940, partial [Paracoccaceae bacterium]
SFTTLQIGSTGTGITGTSSHKILPSVNNARIDNTVDLGDSSYRFKNGYFSGNLYGNGSNLTGISTTPPTSYGAVGTYIGAWHTSKPRTTSRNSTVSGSSLGQYNHGDSYGSSMALMYGHSTSAGVSGTWRAMDNMENSSDFYFGSIWVRIS